MPLPTQSDVHVNIPLTNIASTWNLPDSEYVAPQIFPVVQVNDKTGLVAKYCRKDWFNLETVRPRAPGAKSQGVGFHVDHSTEYHCRNYAHRWELPDEIRANATAPYQLEKNGVKIITQRLKLKREELFAQAAFVPGAWANAGVYGAGAWNLALSTPIADVHGAKIRMKLATGFQPNLLVVNKQVYYWLRVHATIVAIYRNLGGAVPSLSPQQVADALDIERIIVAHAVWDAGPMQGQWDGRWVFGNHALLCYTTSSPSLDMPSAGYTFGYTGANFTGMNVQIEQYRGEEDSKKDIFAGNVFFDVQVVEQDLGVFFNNAVTGAGILNQVVLDLPECL